MIDYADLEISLHRRDVTSYTVELRFSHTRSEANIRMVRSNELPLAQFDLDHLRMLLLDSQAYGQFLSSQLFADPTVQSAFVRSQEAAQLQQMMLRVRLFLGASVPPELHLLRWETLCFPESSESLLTSDHVLFSRYLESTDWRPVHLRPRTDIRALVVIANPTNIEDYAPLNMPLSSIDIAAEQERVTTALGDFPSLVLASQGSATLENFSEHLREGYDIFYLVAHGALLKGEPYLWLENDQGEADVVSGKALITRIREMQQYPRLVVLASCQSADTDYDQTSTDPFFLALGPRLAEAGIPAVLAMHGNITMETIARFIPTFFRELQRDGHIDRAVAIARGNVRDRHDWWMPVLFLRLKSGRIWYVPGFFEDQQGFRKWPALIRSIERTTCTPILGPGLLEPLIGSSRDIARRWAETHQFPMAYHAREDLPQVAQYLAYDQDRQFVWSELEDILRSGLLMRYGPHLSPDMSTASLDELFHAVSNYHQQHAIIEPHRILAQQPLPIYITTNPDSLLKEALEAEGRSPTVVLCPWNDFLAQNADIYDDEPTIDRPLIYYLFGSLSEPESLVITEDDYFNYLIGVTSNKRLIPATVRHALTSNALLLLGFHLEDWAFRALYRSLITADTRNLRYDKANVAVQVDPEGIHLIQPRSAHAYLKTFYAQDANISIYWGSAEDFLHELRAQVARHGKRRSGA
jgi:hypothetical protein